LLGQRKVSDVVMVAILSVALLAGLVGFAVHVLWIAAIVVLALGLGYVVANARQDRRERIDRHREDEERTA
jgi:Flp pilus assembly protein TadB